MAVFCSLSKLKALVLFSMVYSASPGVLKCERGMPFTCALTFTCAPTLGLLMITSYTVIIK